MAVLSVDLACRRWSDLGIVVLDRTLTDRALAGATDRTSPTALLPRRPASPSVVTCHIIPFQASGLDPALDEEPIDAEILAGRLNHLCAVRDIRILMLDGPRHGSPLRMAWSMREPANASSTQPPKPAFPAW